MASFLFKTEPGEYSFDDLTREGRTVWAGVSNNAALAHLRTARAGNTVWIYHTGDEKAIVGLARVDSDPYEDPAHPGRNAKGEPARAVIDIRPVERARSPVPLAAIKSDARFELFALVRQTRLSVMPVPPELDRALRRMTGISRGDRHKANRQPRRAPAKPPIPTADPPLTAQYAPPTVAPG